VREQRDIQGDVRRRTARSRKRQPISDSTHPPAGELAAWPRLIDERANPVRWALVDVDALRRNALAVTQLVGPRCEVMAMVKANAYGHGALLAAHAFLEGGVRRFGASSAEEALQLRGGGVDAPVLVVGWTHPSSHRALVDAGVEAAVYDLDSTHSLATAAQSAGRPVGVHLKLDTGMGRQGADLASVPALLDELWSSRASIEVVGVFTHFADADGPDRNFTEEQHERFLTVIDEVCDRYPDALVHCSNSAGLLRFPEMNHDLVRPGLVLYGYEPAHCEGVVNVEPAMSVLACITRLFTVRRGDSVGYNRTWRAPKDARVAVVAAGYADGVQRAQSNSGHVLVNGVRCPIVGAVSMDQLTVDVSEAASVTVGDVAELLAGAGSERGLLDAAEVARAGRTSVYEVLCAVSARVPRYVAGAARAGPLAADDRG